METHEPYIPPEEHQVFSAAPLSIKDSAQLSGDFISRKEASLKDAAVDLYDAEVHFADAAAGRIVAALKERGIYDDTVVIVASDHGEEFLEHGGTRHANGLYEEVIHVPLIVSIPGREGVEWTGLTRNVDIAPTILGLAGRAEDWPERDGVSLIDVVEGRVSPTESVARLFLDNNNTPRSWDAIQSGDAKLIDARLPNFHYTEMFDLRSDPAEKADLFESRAKEAAALAERLAKARGASRERAKAVVDDETSRAIKAIGYN
jgi:arylsulfatase A-like enzyme